ncbi:MAG TPA: BA14K family protein [Brevundimonas sp.]|jgi:hypothetical protein
MSVYSRQISTWAALALAAPLLFAADPSVAQVYGYQPGGAQDFYGYQQAAVCGDRCGRPHYERRYDRSHQGQVDRPGDYRCDAYWDRGRTDCDAGWRDQRRSWRRGDIQRQSPYHADRVVHYGEYGRPDVVYSGGGYGRYSAGASYRDRYGHDHSQDRARYGQGERNPQRINWCCAEYRSYDPATGYYIAYSGEPVFCG